MIIQEASQELTKEVLTRLDALAAKLGVTVEFLWEVLIKQARVEVIQIGMLFVLASVSVYATVKLWSWLSVKIAESHDDIGYIMLGVTSTIGTAILTIATIVDIVSLPTLLFNPEYWALQEVMKVLN